MGKTSQEKALLRVREEVGEDIEMLLPSMLSPERSEKGVISKMRTCIICGGTRDNGNEKIVEDYCQRCLDTDVETLHRRHMRIDEKKALKGSRKESEEGLTK